jgi:hypothetical protein
LFSILIGHCLLSGREMSLPWDPFALPGALSSSKKNAPHSYFHSSFWLFGFNAVASTLFLISTDFLELSCVLSPDCTWPPRALRRIIF